MIAPLELTNEEMILILKRRADAKEKQDELSPKKEGFLKEDYYLVDPEINALHYGYNVRDLCILSSQDKEEFIKDLFSSKIPKGERFVCYIRRNCADNLVEEWYNEDYCDDKLDSEMAANMLENIRDL